jgi:hypothetical protein
MTLTGLYETYITGIHLELHSDFTREEIKDFTENEEQRHSLEGLESVLCIETGTAIFTNIFHKIKKGRNIQQTY